MRPGYCLLVLGVALVNAQPSIPALLSTSFTGQGDAQGNMWGTLTARIGTPEPALLGAPFSAQESRKNEQVLADGTRISRLGTPGAKVARDAQGRTRVERSLVSGPLMNIPGRPQQKPLLIVEINDPVDGCYYVLDAAKKIAYRVKYSPPQPRNVAPARQAAPPSLLEKLVQGVPAEGRRQTTVTPVGARGKDRPVTQVSETWTAPSLELTILATTKDPTAESTFELVNLSLANPPRDLFLPPAGYEVRDQADSFTVDFGVRPAGAVSTSSFSGGSATLPAPQGTQR
jgi:hypothetical protein